MPPSARNEKRGWSIAKPSAWKGLSEAKTAGSWTIWETPSSASTTNQTSMIGPNSRPSVAVPRCWLTKSVTRIAAVMTSTNGSSPGTAISSPSTADSTEMAGVIMPSP